MNAIFDFIAIPFGYLMEFCCWISPGNNYLIALIFFTIIIQLLLCLLFGIKQQKNMIKQASIAPVAAAIRKKYQGRDDAVTKQKMQQETMELYQKYGYNPLSGCLPMFVQLPIIMALYNVIVSPIEHMFRISADKISTLIKAMMPYCSMESSDSFLSVTALQNLCQKSDGIKNAMNNSRQAQVEIFNLVKEGKLDVLTGDAAEIVEELKGMSAFFPEYKAFGIDFSLAPPYPNADNFKDIWPLLFVPVLIVATMILSTILSKKFTYQDPTMTQQQSGCSMKVMMYSMPLLSAYISFSLPAAVGVYWIYRSVATTLQQFIMSIVMPLPKFTEEDYKKAEKELAGKKPQKKNSDGTTVKTGKYAYNADGTVKRSLHHIDEEDDGTAALALAKKNEEDEKLAPDLDPSEAPVMKDDKGSTQYKKKH